MFEKLKALIALFETAKSDARLLALGDEGAQAVELLQGALDEILQNQALIADVILKLGAGEYEGVDDAVIERLYDLSCEVKE